MNVLPIEPAAPEDPGRLFVVEDGGAADYGAIADAIRKDFVVLVRNLTAERAEAVMHGVAGEFGLSESLEMHADLAFLGNRVKTGKYFMTVNKRDRYRIVTPHSEGTSFVSMQLASFYCMENTTDGGETILFHVEGSGDVWPSLRERVRRGIVDGKPLPRRDIERVKWRYQVSLPADGLREDDEIVRELPCEVAGVKIVEVLAKPVMTYSRILDRTLYGYWDSIDSTDHDSIACYADLLGQWGLLRLPPGGLTLQEMDSEADRRMRHSGAAYARIFGCRVTRKLAPGELVIQNNMTWAHAVANWTPGSGVRKVVAAFA